jgi:hypothetical protein
MGTNLSIDKHVSSLDELLEMSASYFHKVKFESKISPEITQHLKVSIASVLPVLTLTLLQIWRISEDNSQLDGTRASPVPLSNME